jgi:hypothetical protein
MLEEAAIVVSTLIRPVAEHVSGTRDPREGRMPAAIAGAAGFGVGLLLAAGFALFEPSRGTGVAVLAVATIVLSWFATVPGALGIGVLGWLFYSGFVAHSHGHLAVTGAPDAIVAAVLIGLALVVSVLRAVLAVRAHPTRPAGRRPAGRVR